MLKMIRGTRSKLEDYLDPRKPFSILMQTRGKAVYDTCCFGVDSNDKLSDERYMIFYNQPVSPGNAVSMRNEGQDFIYTIDLGKLPGNIVKLVFTVSIDGNGTMGEIESHTLRILQNGSVCAELEISGSDFRREKAIIGMEIYNKTVWRCSIVARGFDGGLADLLANFGGQLADDEQQPSEIPTVTSQSPTASYPVEPVQEEQQIADRMMSRINLSKDKIKLEKHVVNLSKCIIDLSKKNCIDLVNTKAKVVVALDYSGSMSSLYSNGTVQETLNKFVPLGLTFDDNGSIDIFLFQSDFRKMTPLNVNNYENYVNHIIKKSGYRMGGTKYAPVLNAVIEGYQEGLSFSKKFIPPIVDNGDPTLILFITDGENEDHMSTDVIIRKSASKNVFIQFIGIGRYSFRYLEKLDNMRGRSRDNTGFSKMADLAAVADSKLYSTALNQFSNWLRGVQ